MNNVPGKRLDYPTQKIVFRYLRFGIRKQMNRTCSVPVSKQTNSKMPYTFNSIVVRSTDTESILMEIDEYDGDAFVLHDYYTYKFEGRRVIRKTFHLPLGEVIEKVFETGRRMEENVKAFLEFLLNRKNTWIRRFELKTLSSLPNLELNHSLGVTDLYINAINMHSNLLSQIRAPIRKVYCDRTSRSSTVHNLVLTTKKVRFTVYQCRNQLDWVNRLAAHKISLDLRHYDGDSTEIANFLKGFALMNKEMDSQLKLKGDVKILREILATVKKDTNWSKKYFDKTECASLTTGSQEIILHLDRLVLRLDFKPNGSASVNAPPTLRMPFDIAWKVFKFLPYTAREAIFKEPEYDIKYCSLPVTAHEVVFQCSSGFIGDAIVDGKTVQCRDMFYSSLNKEGSFIKHLIVRGNLDFFCFDHINLHVETLTLDFDEAYPERFAGMFASEALPKVIYANCQETTKHLGNLLKNAEVVYKNGHADNGPPAKKAKLAVSDQ